MVILINHLFRLQSLKSRFLNKQNILTIAPQDTETPMIDTNNYKSVENSKLSLSIDKLRNTGMKYAIEMR